MKAAELSESGCGVAQTLAVIGDRWTMLILRDAFHGVRRFDQFQAQLAISSSVLSDRLARLVREGVLERRAAPDDGRGAEYRLTPAGLDLYPVLIALNQWGDRWRPDPAGERLQLLERATGAPIRGAEVIAADGRTLTARDVIPAAGPALAPDLALLVETHRKRLMKKAG